MTATVTEIPGLTAGTWTIDTTHSEVGFVARHLMISKVRGTFSEFEGSLEIAENLLDSKVQATIQMASVDTNEETRDNHLRTNDFFAIEEYPTMTYVSTGLRPDGQNYIVEGNLTLRGVTKPVELELEVNGVGGDPWGGQRVGFTATAVINRKDFGVNFNAALEGGGVVVSDKINIHLEVEAVLAQA